MRLKLLYFGIILCLESTSPNGATVGKKPVLFVYIVILEQAWTLSSPLSHLYTGQSCNRGGSFFLENAHLPHRLLGNDGRKCRASMHPADFCWREICVFGRAPSCLSRQNGPVPAWMADTEVFTLNIQKVKGDT